MDEEKKKGNGKKKKKEEAEMEAAKKGSNFAQQATGGLGMLVRAPGEVPFVVRVPSPNQSGYMRPRYPSTGSAAPGQPASQQPCGHSDSHGSWALGETVGRETDQRRTRDRTCGSHTVSRAPAGTVSEEAKTQRKGRRAGPAKCRRANQRAPTGARRRGNGKRATPRPVSWCAASPDRAGPHSAARETQPALFFCCLPACCCRTTTNPTTVQAGLGWAGPSVRSTASLQRAQCGDPRPGRRAEMVHATSVFTHPRWLARSLLPSHSATPPSWLLLRTRLPTRTSLAPHRISFPPSPSLGLLLPPLPFPRSFPACMHARRSLYRCCSAVLSCPLLPASPPLSFLSFFLPPFFLPHLLSTTISKSKTRLDDWRCFCETQLGPPRVSRFQARQARRGIATGNGAAFPALPDTPQSDGLGQPAIPSNPPHSLRPVSSPHPQTPPPSLFLSSSLSCPNTAGWARTPPSCLLLATVSPVASLTAAVVVSPSGRRKIPSPLPMHRLVRGQSPLRSAKEASPPSDSCTRHESRCRGWREARLILRRLLLSPRCESSLTRLISIPGLLPVGHIGSEQFEINKPYNMVASGPITSAGRNEPVIYSRVTRSGRRLHYRLEVIQQPERARACGSGPKCKRGENAGVRCRRGHVFANGSSSLG